jgi:hypothetical protein
MNKFRTESSLSPRYIEEQLINQNLCIICLHNSMELRFKNTLVLPMQKLAGNNIATLFAYLAKTIA